MVHLTSLKPFVTRFYLLLLACLLLVLSCPVAYAQQSTDWKKINVSVQATGQPIRQVLNTIEKQISMNFSYDAAEVDLDQKITITFKGSLYNAFREIGTLASLDFLQNGNTITIRKRKTTLNVADARVINGKVVDKEDNTPLPGVMVVVKGTTKATSTDLNGEFSFRLVKENIPATVLEFRFMGMRTQEVVIGNQSRFEVALEQNAHSLQEVVVTSSYEGEKRREEVVGSISQLSSRELQVDRPIESFDKMMQGLIAGVHVETSTEPNKPVKVNIRGQNSFTSFGGKRNTSTQPLYVVDGVPMYEQQRGDESLVFSDENYLNPLSNINPQDIQSISVLKDASASAIYGADAANGVIIITTKAGKSGKPKINFDYSTGVSTFINEFKYLSGPQYYELLRETYINNKLPVKTAETLAGSKTIDTDWFDLLNRNGSYQNANFSLSGGSETTTYRFSAGYMNQQSSAKGNELSKMFVNLRLNHKLSDKLEFGVKLSPTLTRQSGVNSFGGIILPPNIAAYDENGNPNELPNFKVANPVAVQEQNEDFHEGISLTGSANLNYKVTPALSFSGTVGTDYYDKKETQFRSARNATGRNLNGALRIYDRKNLGWIAFMQGMYDKTFLDKHSVNIIAGTQVQDQETNLLYGYGSGFTYDRMRELSQAQNEQSGSSKNAKATLSYYAQAGYDLNKKYFLNVNARADKSSVFGGDKQVALNGSIGLGWIVTKESFLQPNAILNHMRLRASYGSTGNSRIGTYAARGLYAFTGTSNYDGNTGSVPDGSAAPNPDLGWEKSIKLNVGMDVSLFNRIDITAEVYQNTIKDLITSVEVPNEIGFETVSANTGTMQNRGFELTINSTNVQKQDMYWTSSFNLGLNRNKITALNNGLLSQYSAATSASVNRVGISTGSIWGYEWGGVDPATGEEWFYDKHGNRLSAREINALPISEGKVIGDRLPLFEGGLVNTLNYKALTFSFNIIYSYGASFLADYTVQSDGRNLDHRNQSINLLDRWQQPGDMTNVPKLYFPRPMSIVSNSSRYVHDLTHIKLSNVSLTYQLPEPMTRFLHLENLSVFTNASNLLYWYREKSPEGRNGIAETRFIYPEMMTVTGGIRLGF
ncbi:SusC/RagA family TonB-linked outer membrane protein [Pontibacter sp. Tf4]|uniref:SusC/RagA family TonB-linked outer membrane protein n=1 Tax=Pontibacter sp. Tf4 TaxID=2761620 RepID=UPI001628ADE9|nr:SusC/RagA family TonB-linked outer membrane protein [Pontibacter sp. Tf4]MBB6612644.1 SusC/RagA family TonB-linked outer membrane protein [Pontibacter sp. Tf4]